MNRLRVVYFTRKYVNQIVLFGLLWSIIVSVSTAVCSLDYDFLMLVFPANVLSNVLYFLLYDSIVTVFLYSILHFLHALFKGVDCNGG